MGSSGYSNALRPGLAPFGEWQASLVFVAVLTERPWLAVGRRSGVFCLNLSKDCYN
jgi:hypothetical protein